ncbi:MAG: DUF4382 domain-containing protein [Gallionella sp.]
MKVFDHYPKSKPLAWLMVSLLTALVTGCGSGADIGTGTIGVSLTDTPACGFDKVYVTVNKVRVHQRYSASDKDNGWTDITLDPARKIDLLSLNNGALDNLGEAPLAAGHYTQLRLVLDPNTSLNPNANSVVPTGGVETSLVTPSAVQTGIKLINEFDVASGQRVDLMLDFNACKSIVKRGNGTYALKPVIKVIPFVQNGIRGFVDPALLGSNNSGNVMVTAQQNGNVVQSTAPMITTDPTKNGKFFLTRLVPGIYDVVITADGQATAVITGVPVDAANSIVDISDSGTPITLHASATNHTVSGTATLNPTSTTEVAYVTAKQTFGAAPVVTVKSVAADDSSSPPGAYTLTLPADAPWLGQYTAIPPPIILTAQSGVSGQYTMEASANGYQTSPPANVDISAGNAENINFTLAP